MGTTKSTNEDLKKALNQMKERFRTSKYIISTGSKHLSECAAEELKNEIETNYNSFISSLSNDHQDHTYHVDIIPRGDDGYDVDVVGLQVIYDEFGTGIEGLQNPHPRKSNHSLNAYNTGPTIHHYPDSNRDYWVYPSKDGFASTHGVPSGQFIFNSIIHMENGIWINNYFDEAFGDLKKLK